MGKCKHLSDLEKGRIVVARQLGQCISVQVLCDVPVMQWVVPT